MKLPDNSSISFFLVVLFLIVLFLALIFGDRISVIGKTILTKESACTQGWICLDEKTSAYQKRDCDISYQVTCLNICEEGMCK